MIGTNSDHYECKILD